MGGGSQVEPAGLFLRFEGAGMEPSGPESDEPGPDGFRVIGELNRSEIRRRDHAVLGQHLEIGPRPAQ